jgi:hypothetical protein
MLVMWCLYFVEKHDIILYHCLPTDTTEGASFVHSLCDYGKGKHNGALSLLKIVERSIEYHKKLDIVNIQEQKEYRYINTTHQDLPSSPLLNGVFRPPST